jgi:hypothetical protein
MIDDVYRPNVFVCNCIEIHHLVSAVLQEAMTPKHQTLKLLKGCDLAVACEHNHDLTYFRD